MRRSATIRWATLKHHYNDPTVMKIMNKLEQVFEIGLKLSTTEGRAIKNFQLKLKNCTKVELIQIGH